MLIIAVACLYVAGFIANEALFAELEHHRGAHWVFLPAGLRMLSVLLLRATGAIGIFLGSLIVVWHLGESDLAGYIAEPLISASAPLITYYLALRFGLSIDLKNLSAKILILLSLGFASMNALLQSIWYTAHGITDSFIDSFVVMFVGDVLGTLIVIYVVRACLYVADARAKRSKDYTDSD